MSSPRLRVLIPGLLLAACLAPLPLAAQEKAARHCRVLFLGGADNDPESLLLYDGTSSQTVELPRMNFSKRYQLPTGALTLRLLSTPPVAGEALPAGLPSVAVDEATTDFYLLVTPDASQKPLPMRLQVIAAGQDRFKRGQMMWYNLTTSEVSGQVGKQKLALKARSKLVVDAPATAVESYHVDLSFRLNAKDVIRPLCETQWTHDPTARSLVFVMDEPGSRAPRILGFPDSAEDAGEEKEKEK
jgi:hypothetical protein